MHSKLLLTLTITILLLACKGTRNNNPAHTLRFSTFQVDSSIKKQLIFEIMESGEIEENPFDADEKEKAKMATNLAFIKLDDRNNLIYNPRYDLTCIAKEVKDTLKIEIGENDGFTGAGISIMAVGDKFTTQPYEYTDLIIDENIPKQQYKIESQKLTLSQSKYAIGDSLYGYVYTRITDQDNIKYYAVGFFRAKVKGTN